MPRPALTSRRASAPSLMGAASAACLALACGCDGTMNGSVPPGDAGSAVAVDASRGAVDAGLIGPDSGSAPIPGVDAGYDPRVERDAGTPPVGTDAGSAPIGSDAGPGTPPGPGAPLDCATATCFFVSPTGSNGDARSWATAWRDSGDIRWASVTPGSYVVFDGGASGLTYATLGNVTVSGTASAPITITRATEAGRDGIVTLGTPWALRGSYVVVDGRAWHGITVSASRSSYTGDVPSGCAVLLDGPNNTLRNVFLNGNYAASTGHSLGISASSGTTRVERTDFYQSVWEDQWVADGGGGTIVFDHCVFRDNNKPRRTDDVHRDVANPWTGPGGWSLTISNSLFFNTPGRDGVSGFQGDQLLIQNGYGGGGDARLGRIELFNNVAFNTARFFVFGSQSDGAESVTAYNNTFLDVSGTIQRGSTSTPMTIVNSLSGRVADFLDADSPLGADGLPFTDDDGFNLVRASAAIDPATDAGTTTDIRGRAKIGARDLGAYEFTP